MTAERSQNFGFLADGHDPVFHQLALGAERAALADPNAALVKLWQLGEAFALHAAAAFPRSRTGEPASILLDRIRSEREKTQTARDRKGSKTRHHGRAVVG